MVLIEMGDCLPGGSSGLLIEASREEMREVITENAIDAGCYP